MEITINSRHAVTKQIWELAGFSLVHILIFVVVFNIGIYAHSDLAVYFEYSSHIMQGHMPYRDFAVEYPPMALIFLTLPRLFSSDISTFAHAFKVQMLLFDLLGLFLISVMARRLHISQRVALITYSLALLAIGPIVTERYDLIPAIMVLVALYAFIRDRQNVAWATLAVGMLTKIYPVVIAPIFLLHNLRYSQKQRAIDGATAFCIVTAAIIIPCLALSPEGFLKSLSYHAERSLQCESIYASFLLLGHTLGLTSAKIVFSSGSFNVISPLASTLAKFSYLITLFLLGVIYWLFYKSEGKRSVESTLHSINVSGHLMNYSLLAVLAFMVSGKVLSPQFIVWLYPLIPVMVGQRLQVLGAMFIAIALMTYYIFPLHYEELIDLGWKLIYILLGRNILLVALTGLLLVEKHLTRSDGEESNKLNELKSQALHVRLP